MDVAIDERGLLDERKSCMYRGKLTSYLGNYVAFFALPSWTGLWGVEEVGERVLEGSGGFMESNGSVHTVRQGREERRTALGARRARVSPSLPAVPRDFRSLGTLFLDDGWEGEGGCGL